MKHFWDERYADDEFVYGKMPNAYFKEFIDSSLPGNILLPAEGEGRNALYALQNGWQVNAVDYSEAGKKKALKLAEDHGYQLNYAVADLAEWNEEIEPDAIALLYAHFPSNIRSVIHNKLFTKLKKGGQIVMEAFSTEQLKYNSGGPSNLDLLYSKSILESDFKDLKIEYLEELEVEIQEGEFHKGKAAVVRMIAKK